MELEKISVPGITDTYAVTCLKKEIRKSVDETWKDEPPWKRYTRKLIEDLSVLCEDKEKAIERPQFEKLTDEGNLYSIKHPETPKNFRVIYTIVDGIIILLVAFCEKNDGDYQKAIKLAQKRFKMLNE